MINHKHLREEQCNETMAYTNELNDALMLKNGNAGGQDLTPPAVVLIPTNSNKILNDEYKDKKRNIVLVEVVSYLPQ